MRRQAKLDSENATLLSWATRLTVLPPVIFQTRWRSKAIVKLPDSGCAAPISLSNITLRVLSTRPAATISNGSFGLLRQGRLDRSFHRRDFQKNPKVGWSTAVDFATATGGEKPEIGEVSDLPARPWPIENERDETRLALGADSGRNRLLVFLGEAQAVLNVAHIDRTLRRRRCLANLALCRFVHVEKGIRTERRGRNIQATFNRSDLRPLAFAALQWRLGNDWTSRTATLLRSGDISNSRSYQASSLARPIPAYKATGEATRPPSRPRRVRSG